MKFNANTGEDYYDSHEEPDENGLRKIIKALEKENLELKNKLEERTYSGVLGRYVYETNGRRQDTFGP